MRRRLLIALGVLLGLLLLAGAALSWLAFTEAGARWALGQVLSREPRLALELDGGTLARGLRVRDLSWQAETLRARVERAELAWTPSCLMAGKLCIERVGLAGVAVEVLPAEQPPVETAERAPFSLPVPIAIGQLEVERLELSTPTAALQLTRAQTSADLANDGIRIGSTTVVGLDVRLAPGPAAARVESATPVDTAPVPSLPVALEQLRLEDFVLHGPDYTLALAQAETTLALSPERLALGRTRLSGVRAILPEPPAAAADATGQDRDSPISLPDVALPFAVTVADLVLADVELRRGEQQWALARLAVAGRYAERRLRLERLRVEHTQGVMEARGEVLTQGQYPLDLTLSARAELEGLPGPQALRASLSGNLAELQAELILHGALELRVTGEVQPLAPRVPFSLQLDSPRLGWPLDAPRWQAEALSASVSGDLDGYELRLAGRIAGENIPAADVRLNGHGDLSRFVADLLLAETLGGQVQGSGEVAWRDGVDWQAELSLQGIEPARQWPDYPGRLSGIAEARGAVADGQWSLQLSRLSLDGELRGYPFALQGRVAREFGGAWRIAEAALRSGPNRIEVAGRIDAQWALSGRYSAPELRALYPELGGSASGEFDIAGALARPDVSLRTQARQLSFQDLRVAALELELGVRALGEQPSALSWTATGLSRGEVELARLAGSLRGTRSDHRLELNAVGEPGELSTAVSGSLSESLDWQGRVERAVVAHGDQRWLLVEPLALRWNQQASALRVAEHCWQREQARLCLLAPASVGTSGELRLGLEEFRLAWLAPYLPPGVFLDGGLEARAELAWGEGAPRLQLQASSGGGQLLLSQEDAPALELPYQRLAVDFGLQEGQLRSELQLDSEQLGQARVVLSSQLGGETRPLSGEVRIDGLQLALAKPFLPQLQAVAGVVDLRGEISGTLAAPRFSGSLDLIADTVEAPALPLRIGALELHARIAGSEASFDGGFQSGDGSAKLSGRLDWGGEQWQLVGNLRGERLRVIYPPIARLSVSPDLEFRIVPKTVRVTGSVRIPEGEITLRELPEQAVAVSSDVVVVRRPGEPPPQEIGVQEPPAPPPAPGWQVVSRIEISFGDAVALSGYGLTGRLEGSLRLRQRGEAAPEAVGELRVVDGRYEAYGQKLTIRQGRLIFSGPVTEPNLYVEAVREVRDVVAGVRVEGQPREPRVSLFSQPGLPQEDILSYIVRGRPLSEGGGGSEEAFLAQAALALGVFGGERYAGALAEELGIQDFEMGASGEGEDTRFELSGYLAPNLFIRYGIGVFQAENELSLRYELNKRLYIEAMSGASSAVDLMYEFEF